MDGVLMGQEDVNCERYVGNSQGEWEESNVPWGGEKLPPAFLERALHSLFILSLNKHSLPTVGQTLLEAWGEVSAFEILPDLQTQTRTITSLCVE